MSLSSPAFLEGGAIPAAHTCEGKNLPPDLVWKGVPAGTQSLALIVDDPDAPDPAKPERVWVHCVVVNLPPSSSGWGAGPLPEQARFGVNDWQHDRWEGPCPPIGRHRYFFRLYALDQWLELVRPTRSEVEAAIDGHVIEQATLMGTYQKQRSRT
jgi:Raf kinase inhibitor-like YbhB/YbcL family protein